MAETKNRALLLPQIIRMEWWLTFSSWVEEHRKAWELERHLIREYVKVGALTFAAIRMCEHAFNPCIIAMMSDHTIQPARNSNYALLLFQMWRNWYATTMCHSCLKKLLGKEWCKVFVHRVIKCTGAEVVGEQAAQVKAACMEPHL